MLSHLPLIADKIKNKLSSQLTVIPEKLERDLNLPKKLTKKNSDACLHLLLKIACKFNLLIETHELLALNLFNVDEPLKLKKKKEKTEPDSDNGKTLLGLAAFHGHYELTCYLVEVRMANVHAKDINGDTPLHQVVYGDSYPYNNCNYGTSHDKVAQYLIRHGGDLSIRNDAGKTPYEQTKWCAPLIIEPRVRKNFATNPGPAIYYYYADKVRPIFEEELARLKRNQDLEVVIIGGKRQAQSFEKFCLEHAIEEYVKDKKPAFGYSSFEELYKKLDSLSEEEWQDIRGFISSQGPSPYSFTYGPIANQIPRITKQSAMLGLIASFSTYYPSESPIFSGITGFVFALATWFYLTQTRLTQEEEKRSIKEERVGELQQHNRFFKSPRQLNMEDKPRLAELNSKAEGLSEALKRSIR